MGEMRIRPYAPGDLGAVRALWERCNLTRPWNDPEADVALAVGSGHGAILVGEDAGKIVAAAMVGHDGHRGWVYYVAVDPERRKFGLGRAIMDAAEQWVRERGVPKLQLLVREENKAVSDFYRRLGYRDSGTRTFERWLIQPKVPKPGPRRVETVVTYLEMLAPPAYRPASQPPYKLALLRIAKPSVAFYRYLYGAVGETCFWYERRAMCDQDLAAAISAEGVEISVLYAEGEPAGYAELDYRDKANANLAYFGLVPGRIGQGLGTYMLTWAVDEAWRRRPDRLWVHTCTLDHPRALRLYQKAGFVPYKQETKVIDDPRDKGLIPASVPLPAAARLAGSA